MFGKILVGTDGSDTASVAVAEAAALAQRMGSELLVVHAFTGVRHDESPLGPREEDFSADDRGRGILEHVAREQGEGLNLRTVLQEGKPADVLVDVAEEEDVDLLVVGNVGMTGARRFLGSVPNNVSHHAPCHVLIVHTAWAADTSRQIGKVSPYRKVLMGTDGSPTGDRAMDVGAEVARTMGAEVLLLHVGNPDRGEEVLRTTTERIGKGLAISSATMEGDPADKLLDVAQREQADLIVVGSRGMTGAKRLLLGSVPNNIVHHARGHVLIAKTT